MYPLRVYTKIAEAPRLLAMADALAHSSSLTLPSAFGARDGSMICPYFSCLQHQQAEICSFNYTLKTHMSLLCERFKSA